jgi:transposase InsO family protein
VAGDRSKTDARPIPGLRSSAGAVISLSGLMRLQERAQGVWARRSDRSMGSVGDCCDNSMIEAFWSRMQVELLDRRHWKTRVELANAIFDYLEIWHNRRRRHSSLGMLTPIEFENQAPTSVA